MRRLLSCALIGFATNSVVPAVTHAAPFNEAQIKNIVDGSEVYINSKSARIKEIAKAGQTLSTGVSRAELLFDKTAIGYLGKSSLITLGEDCYRLKGGSVLINGGQRACIGSKVLGVKGTTYVLAATIDDTYTLSVLHGEAVIGPSNALEELPQVDIQNLYPKVSNIIGLNTSAYANNAGGENLGGAAGLVLGGASALIPLYQSESKSILYSNNFANSNFDGFWGASSEIGYKQFSPETGAIKGIFIGYDGYEQPGCFHSQIALGADYQFKNRWSVGANGGIKADSCESSISHATLQITAPIGQIGDNSITLSVSPYILTGIGEDFGGARASLEIPISNHASISAYSQYDGLFSTTVGGMLSYRFGTAPGGSLIKDPNSKKAVQNLAVSESISEQDTNIVKAGEEVVLNKNGEIVSRSTISKSSFEGLVESLMDGQNPIPEGIAIYNMYKDLYGVSNHAVMASTGAYAMQSYTKAYPRFRGADNLFVPDNRLDGSSRNRAGSDNQTTNKKDNKKDNNEEKTPTDPTPTNPTPTDPTPTDPTPTDPDVTPDSIFIFGSQGL